MNEPVGRFGWLRPARDLKIASATAVTAVSCPTTRLCNTGPSTNKRSRSVFINTNLKFVSLSVWSKTHGVIRKNINGGKD